MPLRRMALWNVLDVVQTRVEILRNPATEGGAIDRSCPHFHLDGGGLAVEKSFCESEHVAR
jgi:hypothetical protein